MANCIYKYKGKNYTKEEFYSLVSSSNFVQQEQAKKFAELQERLNNKEFLEGAKNGEQIRDVEDIQETKPNRQLGLFDNNTYYQIPKSREKEEYVASEKTIRDLAARMSDRIGIPVKFESDRTKEYKGKLENGVAYVNLAYADLSTPVHEIAGHSIIRALKIKSENNINQEIDNMIEKGYIIKKCD